MKLTDFDYPLPEELIALHPIEPRDHSRLLVVNRKTGEISHHHFYDLPKFLNKGDLLVRNNTKVIPARLLAADPKGNPFEIFLLSSLTPDNQKWSCLVKPGKKVKEGLAVTLSDGTKVEVTKDPAADFLVVIPKRDHFFDWLTTVGKTPLPPYIKREATADDLARYQTVYAEYSGSIAAPTAGLHFTSELFKSVEGKGVGVADVTLNVGYGTFSPIRAENIADHVMHEEAYQVSEATLKKLRQTREAGHRIIAIGTTSLRTLESLPLMGSEGKTKIFITPGYDFKQVDALITNFHLPESTLFILMCAFLGMDLAKKAYAEAVEQRYRFFSYGDAMLAL